VSRSTTRSTGGSSTRRRARRAATLVALGLAGAVALGGCSAGQIAETAVKVPAVAGVDANVGDIAIRNAAVSFPATGYNWPAGSDVPLQLQIANNGAKADELVSASAQDASSVTLRMVPEGGQASSTPEPLPSAPTGTPTPTVSGLPSPPPSRGTAPGLASASSSPSSSASSTGSASPSGSATETPGAGQSFPLTLPAQQVTSLTNGGLQLVLVGLSKQLDPSATVTVTLQFAEAGTVTLKLPFAPPSTPLPRESPSAESSTE
jgi:copper(I)-binding protein